MTPGPGVPTPARDPWAHRRGEPRTFAALWISFLFLAAALALGTGGALGLVATDVYRAAARVMFVVAGAGVGVLWPMLRLSQERPAGVGRAVFHDAVIVGLSMQAIVLPQFLPWMGAWPIGAVGTLAAGFAAWAVLVSGLMGWWWRFMGDMPRAVGMGLVLAAVAAGPLASLLVPDEGVLAQCLLAGSPLTIAHEVLRDRSWTGLSAMPQPAHAWTIAGTMAGGLVLCWSASGRVAVRGGPA